MTNRTTHKMLSHVSLLSIITPSLNQCAYITEAIDSVMKETHTKLEYIILDGGSTDGTFSVLEEYGRRYQQIRWMSESDKGQAAAVNKGMKMAKGDIIAWLNADDVYMLGALDIVSEYFQKYPEVDIVYGDCDYTDEAEGFLEAYSTAPYDYAKLVKFAINYIPQPATFIRRRVLESVGFLDESLHYVMDYDYWIRAGLRHNIAYIPVKLAKMRVHRDAKSIKNLGNFSQELLAIYTKLFSSVDLPDAVRKLEKEAMHHAYYRAAHIAFWANQPDRAYQYGQKALQLKPSSIRCWKLLFLANKLGARCANILIDNPYFLGIKRENL